MALRVALSMPIHAAAVGCWTRIIPTGGGAEDAKCDSGIGSPLPAGSFPKGDDGKTGPRVANAGAAAKRRAR